jgi:hypothetical protein
MRVSFVAPVLVVATLLAGCAVEADPSDSSDGTSSAAASGKGDLKRYAAHTFALDAKPGAAPAPFVFEATAGKLAVLLRATASTGEEKALKATGKPVSLGTVSVIKCEDRTCASGKSFGSSTLTVRSDGLLQIDSPDPDAFTHYTVGGTFAVSFDPLPSFQTSALSHVDLAVTASW